MLTIGRSALLFIALTTSLLKESAPAYEFQLSNVLVDFSSNCCPLNLLFVQSHQGEIIIVKRLIQGRDHGAL